MKSLKKIKIDNQFLKYLELAIIAIGIIGAPVLTPFFGNFLLNNFPPDDVDGITSKLILGEGDTLTIDILDFDLDYSVIGNSTGYSFIPGIYFQYHSHDYRIYETLIGNDGNETYTYQESYTDYNSLMSQAPVLYQGSIAKGETRNIQFGDSNKTHALATIEENNNNFSLTHNINRLDFVYPYLAPGIKIINNSNPKNVFIAWFHLPIFTTTRTRFILDIDTNNHPHQHGEKINSNQYRYPSREFYPDGIRVGFMDGVFTIERLLSLYPSSSKISAMNYNGTNGLWFNYWGLNTDIGGGYSYNFNITANVHLNLEFQYS